MIVKILPPTSRKTEDELQVTQVVTENGTSTLVVDSPKSMINLKSDTEAIPYDPQEIREHYRQRPLKVLRRIFAVLRPTLSFVFGLWWDNRRGIVVKKDPRRAVQLRELLTKLGPAYIKIGQALSTRPDLVPPTYLEE
jgi:hypothetical protein